MTPIKAKNAPISRFLCTENLKRNIPKIGVKMTFKPVRNAAIAGEVYCSPMVWKVKEIQRAIPTITPFLKPSALNVLLELDLKRNRGRRNNVEHVKRIVRNEKTEISSTTNLTRRKVVPQIKVISTRRNSAVNFLSRS